MGCAIPVISIHTIIYSNAFILCVEILLLIKNLYRQSLEDHNAGPLFGLLQVWQLGDLVLQAITNELARSVDVGL